ncbi:MAG: hypothetical protein LWW85_01885 [Marinilabiliales bacterium]|nr:hypothetical protein [Marinilabiliales bacterium]
MLIFLSCGYLCWLCCRLMDDGGRFGAARLSVHAGAMSAIATGKSPRFLILLFPLLFPFSSFSENVGTLSLLPTHIACKGNATGLIQANLTGGSGGMVTYKLTPGSVSNTSGLFVGLIAGTYAVEADDGGNLTTASVTLVEPLMPLSATIQSRSDVLCKGSASGSFEILASGGTQPSLFSLDGGTTTQSSGVFTGLAAGTYHVWITDQAGCTLTQDVTIGEPALPLTVASGTTLPVSCKGVASGSLTVNVAGGTPVYSFSLDGGATTQLSGTFNGLLAGNYHMVVKDAAGCLVTTDLTVSEPASALSATLSSITTVRCKGESNGSFTLSATGGTSPYAFSLNGGMTYQPSGTYSALSAGVYHVTLRDANGCIFLQDVTIGEPVQPLSATLVNVSDVLCKGNADGSLSVAGTGGTPPYSYTIDGGSTYRASGTFGSLSAGHYTVGIRDAVACISSFPVTVGEPAASLSCLASANNPVCTSGSLNLAVTASGGTAPYSYSWSGPNGFSSNQASPVLVSPTLAAAGSYTVQTKDARNCQATSSVTVVVKTSPVVSANASVATLCQGSSVNLTSTSNLAMPSSNTLFSDDFNGASPAWSTTNTSTGGTVASAAWTKRPDGYNSSTTYHSNDNSTFYLSDSRAQNGTKTATTLTSPSFSTVGYSDVTLGFWHYFRYAGVTNESAKVQISINGTNWNDLITYQSNVGASNGFNHETLSLNGYLNKATVWIRFTYNSDARARYWAIDNVNITGTTAVAMPTIAWSSVPSGYTANVANPPAASPATTTTYTVTYTDPSTGCSNSASTTVTVNPNPQVTIQPNYCAVPGKVRLTANGGTNYVWSNGLNTNPIYVDIADTYTVSSTNSYGCTGWASLPVSTELVQNGDFSSGNVGFTNAYGSTTASNGLFPEGLYAVGPDPQFYHTNFWGHDHTTGSGNFLMVNGIGSPGVVVWQETVNLLPNTDYYFSAWAASLNNVAPFANLQFNVNGVLVGTTAPLVAGPTNNSTPLTWQRFYGNWNSGAATTAVIQIVDLQTAANGNDFGLDDVSFGTLAPFPFTIAPTVNPSTSICEGKTMYLNANIVGGKAPITYSWTGPNGFISNQKNVVIPNVTQTYSGHYDLSVVDGYGCDPMKGALDVTILSSPKPFITSVAGASNVCPNSTQKYWTPSQADVTNQWSVTGGTISGSATQDTLTVTWGAPGTGTLRIKSTNAISLCDSTIQKTVAIQDLVPPDLTCPSDYALSGCDEGALTGLAFHATEQIIPLSALNAAGGSATDNCSLATVSYQDSKTGSNPVWVTRTFFATDYAGNKSQCQQKIRISDQDPPVLATPANFSFCVETLNSAAMVANSLQLNPNPDYYLFHRGSTVLDINTSDFSDNCTPVNQLVLHWKIDFSPAIPLASISGTGQLSAYPSDIYFPGDGVGFMDVTHTLTYWLVDLNGNESVHHSVPVVIHPRPSLSLRLDQGNPCNCLKTLVHVTNGTHNIIGSHHLTKS